MMSLDTMKKVGTTVPVTEDNDDSSTDEFELEQDKTAASASDNDFIRKETKQVNCLRILFVLVLMFVGAAVSTVIYFITTDFEDEQTTSYYDASSMKVLNTFEDIIGVKITTITSLTSSITTYAMENNKTWPFVTMASYPTRGAIARSLTGALVVGTNPIVNENLRSQWEQYIVGNESYWMQESYQYQADMYPNYNSAIEFRDPATSFNIVNQSNYPILLSHFSSEVDSGPGPYLVVHQTSPFYPGLTNVNQRSSVLGSEAIIAMDSKSIVIGKPLATEEQGGIRQQFLESTMSIAVNSTQKYVGDPVSNVFVPYFDSLNQDRNVVGFMSILIRWGLYFENILPRNHDKIVVVLENTCTGSYTYRISGSNVKYMGIGDLHDQSYNYLKKSATFSNQEVIPDGTKTGLPLNQFECPFVISTYPSDVPKSNAPIIVTCVVATVFLFTVFMFCFYDHLVEQRNSIVLDRAHQTTAIVSSLFPKSVAERLLQSEVQQSNNKKKHAAFIRQSGSNKLKSFLNNADSDIGQEPIADLFLDTTVMFADIAGFTAWSSTREPVQVFVLLQTLYQGFDEIAQRRKVFKVETIGDSYVAVTGLPEKQQHHALIMARFCGDCLEKTYEIFHELERRLGPDTTELGMRFGMHSGPVTGGVLRGDKARFQLFGDTVNTASRMESTGIRNRIHISEDSANLISAFGKTHWVKLREDKVKAKGKGIMNTYWLNPTARRANSVISSGGEQRTTITYRDLVSTNARHERLVNWVCELILEPLKKIISLRNHRVSLEPNGDATYQQKVGDIPIDEVAKVIVLPDFNARMSAERANYKNIELKEEIMDQLKSYVTAIAATYRDNPFHNFEHACHVTMSVSKLMNRIVAPDIEATDMTVDGKNGMESQLHDHTYGITSDPLALLAIIFSALIHDTDHRGVSNMQLCKEDPMLGDIYKKQSVAEQNSLDISWRILMDDQYAKLRGCLFNNQSDMDHFRQVMVNVVLATDIFDKELNDLRKNRWNKAFHDDSTSKTELIALRATIVIEHIIQASDVSHTMQHWHVYQKWNRRLFSEMRRAFNEGRMGADPAGFWYQGEIGFFDNYIIPLAKKLKECRVFGVSSDEYLNYALQNRAEWAERGQEIVAELIIECPLSQEFEDALLSKKESVIDTKGLLSKKESIIDIKGRPLCILDVGFKKAVIEVLPVSSANAEDKQDDHDMGDKSERSESNYSL